MWLTEFRREEKEEKGEMELGGEIGREKERGEDLVKDMGEKTEPKGESNCRRDRRV